MSSNMDAALPLPLPSGVTPFSVGLSTLDTNLLTQSEARFRALAQATGQIYWIADAQGYLTDTSSWCLFTGQDGDEASGDGWAAALHPDDRESTLADWKATIASGHPYCHKHRARRADGQYRLMLVQAYPVLDAEGAVREWVGVDTDITLLEELRVDVQASQEEFQATFEQAAVGIAHVRLSDGRILRANQKFRDILGYTHEELLSHTFQELTYSPDLDTNLALFEQLLAGEISTYTLEKRYVRKDGSLVWANLTTSLKRNRAGTPEYGIAVVEDISARKAAEEALRRSEQQYRLLFETMAQGVIYFSPRGEVLFANPAALRMLGVTQESLYGWTTQELCRLIVREDGSPCPIEALPTMRALRAGQPISDMVGVFNLKEQAYRWLQVTAIPEFHPGESAPYRVFATYEDITERRRLEQQTQAALQSLLRMAEVLVQQPLEGEEQHQPLVGQRLAELACSLPGCPVATILTLDPQSLRMRVVGTVGYSPAQEAQLHALIASWSHSEMHLAHLARLQAGETLVLDVTQPSYQEQAAPFDVRQAIAAPMLLRGQLCGMVVFNPAKTEQTFTDQQIALAGATAQFVGLVVERERLLREREEARAQALALEKANRQMNTFLSLVSHELRTPLAILKLSLQLISRRLEQMLLAEPETVRQMHAFLASLQNICSPTERQMLRLERLVKDLLDAARLEEGQLGLRLEEVELGALVQEVVEQQRQLVPNRIIQLDPPVDQLLRVRADADRIRQVVVNYLTNALKYSPGDAPVQVGVQRKHGHAYIWVRDEGPGIPLAEQEHLWERFHRVPGIWEQGDPEGGLGLGLYVTRLLIERHQGQVGVISMSGQGSTFWFTLPLAPHEPDEEKPGG